MPEFKLPRRFCKIAELLKRDRAFSEIRAELNISDRTLTNYLQQMRELTNSDNNDELVEFLKSNETAIASPRIDNQNKIRSAIIRLRKQGLTRGQIASRLDIHRNTVGRYLEELDATNSL